MMGLLVFKERLKAFYAKFDQYIISVLKFALSFAVLSILNKNIGYMTQLKNPVIPLVLALICSFMPYGVIVVLSAGFMLMHLYTISMEIAMIVFAILLLVAMLYYGLQPGDSVILLVTPLMLALRIPYVVPLIVGLSAGVSSVVPVCCGVMIYYILLYVKQNAGLLTSGASTEIIQKYVQVIDSIVENQLMFVMMVAFAAALVVVNIIRRLSVNYSWIIAIVAGTITQLVIIFVGDLKWNISVSTISILFGMAGSLAVTLVYHFFAFAVDYSRTENVQFEDDDYYYYVKAVPKISVTEPDVKVQKINTIKNQSRSQNNKRER